MCLRNVPKAVQQPDEDMRMNPHHESNGGSSSYLQIYVTAQVEPPFGLVSPAAHDADDADHIGWGCGQASKLAHMGDALNRVIR